MPAPIDSQASRGFPLRTAVLLAVVLSGLVVAGVKLLSRPGPVKPVPQASESLPATNTAPSFQPPGTLVSAESVLDKLDNWYRAHPNWHSVYTSVFPNGSVVSKMDIYSYANQTNGATAKLKAQTFAPEMEFVGVRENGRSLFYFPKDQQLIEVDIKRDVFFMPGLPPNITKASDLLKQARSSFAEASADLEVVTLAIDGQALNMTNQVFLSFRIKNDGEPLSIGVQCDNQSVMTNIKHVSFDRDVIMRDAPVLPTDIAVVTNTTLVQAVLKELNSATPQPLRPRTI